MIVKVNTHPIISETHDEYHIKWCGQIINTHPRLENGMPIFYIRGGEGGMELNTIDMKMVEHVAQKMTCPRGRAAVTTDQAYIYIVEEDGNKALLGVVTHNHIKTYNQMYDEFEYN